MESQVPKSPRGVCPLLAGMEIPFATVIAEDGTELNLIEAVRQKPAVLVFYRGSW